MKDIEQIIKKLENENKRPDTSPAQRESNYFRMLWLKRMNKDKNISKPIQSTDVMIERLRDPGYTFSPSKILNSQSNADRL